MIPGITASITPAPAAPGGSNTLLDFVAGTYTVGGTSYALTDLLAASSVGGFDAAAIVAGRGLLTTYEDTAIPKAAGALHALLMAPHVAVIEWEDLEWYQGALWQYHDLSGPVLKAHVNRSTSTSLLWESGGSSREVFANGGGDRLRPYGTNRVALRFATSAMAIAQNGGTEGTPQNGSTFFADNTIDEIVPFGGGLGKYQLSGYVRRVWIHAADFGSLAALALPAAPAQISDLTSPAATATTATLAFSAVSGATAYEYLALAGSFMYPVIGDRTAWQALPADKIITSLTPSTSYSVWVRGKNADGPGAAADVQITTTA